MLNKGITYSTRTNHTGVKLDLYRDPSVANDRKARAALFDVAAEAERLADGKRVRWAIHADASNLVIGVEFGTDEGDLEAAKVDARVLLSMAAEIVSIHPKVRP